MTLPDPRTFTAAFHVRLLTRIDEDLLNLALATIALVWDHRVGQPEEFTVSVADNVQSPAGVEANGVYNHTEKHFAFATASMFGRHKGKTRKGLIIRVAAHEAMHAVQHVRGENVELAKRPGSPDYYDDPLEVEAHRESVLVLKGYYADLRGPLPVGGGRYYDVPESSPYSVLWGELERRGAEVRVLSREGPP